MKHNFLKKLMALLLGTIMVFSMIPAIAVSTKAATTASLVIKGTTGKLSSDKSTITWSGDGFTVVNTKGSTAIRNSDSDCYRAYKGSKITVTADAKIDKITITTQSGSYSADKVGTSVNAGNVTVSGTKYVVEFANSVDTFEVTLANQVRITNIEVVFAEQSGAVCEHTNKVAIGEAKEASCTEDGITAGEKCGDCGHVITPQEVIPASHKMDGNTCSVCGYKPEGYVLVENISDLKAGDKIIIVAEDGTNYYAISTNQKSSNRGAVSVTVTNGCISAVADLQIITLEAGSTSGTFAFKVDTGYLYAASSNGNQLKTQSTNNNNGLWTIEIGTDGVASVVAKQSTNRNVMQFNPNNGSPLFACYASASQQAVYIYKLVEATPEQPPVDPNAPVFKGFGLTLNKGVTVRVKFSITQEWLDANQNAMVTFSNGDSFPAEAGEKYYYTTLTPGQIGSGLTVTLGDITKNVSVNDYIAAATANNPNAALVNLLNSIVTYGKATAGEAGVITETFEGVSDVTLADELGVFGEVSAVLGTTANLSIALNNTENLTFTATLGEISISGNVAAEAKDGALIIENLCPLHYNDEIVVTITDTETSETSTLRFTFNAYLAKLYDVCENDAQRALVAAAYQYGVAAEAYQNPQ